MLLVKLFKNIFTIDAIYLINIYLHRYGLQYTQIYGEKKWSEQIIKFVFGLFWIRWHFKNRLVRRRSDCNSKTRL